MKNPPLKIDFIWLEHGKDLTMPKCQSEGAAGLDICAAIPKEKTLIIKPKKTAMVPTGFSIALPLFYEAQIRPRSGLASKYAVTILNSPGTIDCDYRGEVKILLINHGEKDFEIKRGDRIAQMVVAPVSVVKFELKEKLDETGRNKGGFGSTG